MVGRSKFLAVFYHENAPLRDGTQKIGYMLLDGECGTVITKGSTSSISQSSMLVWTGFTNDGSLISMDGEGLVAMLADVSSPSADSSQAQWEWIPMLDTMIHKKSVDDTFWPISAFDGKLVCVPLKGGTKFPDASRRPVTTTLSFRMPLAGGMSKR